MTRLRLNLRKRPVFNSVAGCLALFCLAKVTWPQEYTSLQRAQTQAMLSDVANDVKKHYYDPRLHGIDWDAKVRETEEKIKKTNSLNVALSDIAALLDSLNDSHTFFLPPRRSYVHDYGFQMRMIGDRCYVVRVRPGSDAESKGVKPGDEIVTVNGYTPTRADFWRMHFLFWVLRPQFALRLQLRNPAGTGRQVDVNAKIRELQLVKDLSGSLSGSMILDIIRKQENEEDLLRPQFVEKGNALLIVRLPQFLSPSDVDSVIRKMREHESVILDLRNNPGGREDALQSLLGAAFEDKVKIGERIGRGKSKPIETEPQHHQFTGKLEVLIDSNSASASELLARVVQIQKRGLIIGDRSSGKVMESLQYQHLAGFDTFTIFGDSVTEADIRMTDGESLEGKGVLPDELIFPDPSDLANGRDPVLAKAAESLNVKMSAEEAGKLFPYVWPKD